jgi:hypothetical protein
MTTMFVQMTLAVLLLDVNTQPVLFKEQTTHVLDSLAILWEETWQQFSHAHQQTSVKFHIVMQLELAVLSLIKQQSQQEQSNQWLTFLETQSLSLDAKHQQLLSHVKLMDVIQQLELVIWSTIVSASMTLIAMIVMDAQLTSVSTMEHNAKTLQLIASTSLQMEDAHKEHIIQLQMQQDTACTLDQIPFQTIQLMQMDFQPPHQFSHVINLHVMQDNHQHINANQLVTTLINASVQQQIAHLILAKISSVNQLDNQQDGIKFLRIVEQIKLWIATMETNVTIAIATPHGLILILLDWDVFMMTSLTLVMTTMFAQLTLAILQLDASIPHFLLLEQTQLVSIIIVIHLKEI